MFLGGLLAVFFFKILKFSKISFLDFWRVSAPFPGPGPLQDDRGHRDASSGQGLVSVDWNPSEY